ncbi:unnamed protein product [Rotaria socialis]
MRETYCFKIQADLIIRLADEFNTTQTTISVAMVALLLHRYTLKSDAVKLLAGENQLTIVAGEKTFESIVSSIHVKDANVIVFNLPVSSTIQPASFTSHRLSLNTNQKYSDKSNTTYCYQLTFSNLNLDRKTASDFCNAFQNLVEYLGSNTHMARFLSYDQLMTIPLLSKNTIIESPRSLAVTELSNTSTIYDHFQLVASRYPSRICLQQKARNPFTITYSECIKCVDHLTSILKDELGLKQTSLIGLWMDNSFEYIICILTTFKLGAIFVPLDTKHPAARLELIEKQLLLNIILTNNSILPASIHVPMFNAPRVRINVTMNKELEIEAFQNTTSSCTDSLSELKQRAKPDAGYIIFTSGSTGQPKGVLIEEVNLLNMALSQISFFDIQISDVVAQFASICFDASLSEIFMALLAGACLAIFDSSMDRVGMRFIDALNQLCITVITLPPSLLSTIDPRQLPYIRIVVSAGEPCPRQLGQKWIGCHRRFFNAYGPSEVAVCATIYEFDEKNQLSTIHGETLPIGTLIDNLCARVVDSQLNDVPAGMPGELVLGGVGVSRHGYLNSAQNKVFLAWQEKRWYRTGDLVATVAPNHTIFSYLGRKDSQVKFYGCRIELNEIEMAILRCPHVTYCVVILHNCGHCKNDQGAIVAYVDGSTTVESIHEYLSQILPSYMLPTYIIRMLVTNLPSTLSGKINRQLLTIDKTIHDEHIHNTYLTNVENKLAVLWREVLCDQCDHITNQQLKNRTIAQLGGNSLTIALLHNLIAERFAAKICIHAHMVLNEMATLLSQHDNNDHISYESMMKDLNDDESEIGLKSINSDFRPSLSNQISTMLLTGATGFLGSFLLHELLTTTSMIVLVLVRANSLDEANNRLKSALIKYGLFDNITQEAINNNNKKRVQICLCENLTNENQVGFGFSFNDDQWSQIDAVLHCAADTNFNATYNQLRHVNVLFTKYFIRQCVRYSIPLYYVSSLSIFLFSDNKDSSLRIRETDQPHLPSIIGGYSQSKYIADMLVLRSLRKDLQGAIFRPGRITGSSTTGIGTNEDLFVLMVRGCYKLGAYPHLTFPFDVTPVDLVSKSIVTIIRHQHSLATSYSLPIHLINTQTIPFDEQFKLLCRSGCSTNELEPLPYNEWLTKLLEQIKMDQQRRSPRFNPLLPLIPFLQSPFWQNVHRWPVFEPTNDLDAILDRSPSELFEIYRHVWKRHGFF